MTFGIPMGAIPMRSDGSLIDEINQQYLQKRRVIEAGRKQLRLEPPPPPLLSSSSSSSSQANQQHSKLFIESPGPNDILLGRGRPFQEFSGNQILMELVDAQRSYYQSVDDRFEKTCLTMGIVKKAKDGGGRFLQRTTEGWEEVDDAIARGKVSHTFRTKTSHKKEVEPKTTKSEESVSRTKRIRYDEKLLDMEY
jgi:hypothetical protein